MRKSELIEKVRNLVNDNQIMEALDTLSNHLPANHQVQTSISVIRSNYSDLVATAAGRTDKEHRQAISALKFGISRLYEILPDPKIERKILFLSANPEKTEQLRLDLEARKIEDILESTTHRDDFTWLPKPAVSVKTITGALQKKEPEIVHFSGHGAGRKGIAVEGEGGYILLPNDALSDMFAAHSEHVRCVVMNACYTGEQARVISEHGIYVTGTTDALGDNAAISFAEGFYQKLGNGGTYQEAFDNAMVHIKPFRQDAHNPKLWLNGVIIRE